MAEWKRQMDLDLSTIRYEIREHKQWSRVEMISEDKFFMASL